MRVVVRFDACCSPKKEPKGSKTRAGGVENVSKRVPEKSNGGHWGARGGGRGGLREMGGDWGRDVG